MGGLGPSWTWKCLAKKVFFLILSGKKISLLLVPPGKILEKSPSGPHGKNPSEAHMCDTGCAMVLINFAHFVFVIAHVTSLIDQWQIHPSTFPVFRIKQHIKRWNLEAPSSSFTQHLSLVIRPTVETFFPYTFYFETKSKNVVSPSYTHKTFTEVPASFQENQLFLTYVSDLILCSAVSAG